MKLSTSFTTVTPLSKTLALLLFISLPVIAFYMGMRYQSEMTVTQDLRLQLFSTQDACESFTERVCMPTICEQDPNADSCSPENPSGWFATRKPLIETTIDPDDGAL